MHGQRGFLSDLNLLITKTCTAACAHCSVESSPTNRQKMSEDTFANVLKLIEVFAKLPESRRIVVTGGEPYLERERLKQIVALAHHE
ncbi:MAG: radical SAM protein, partial [Myxococcota bacterium]